MKNKLNTFISLSIASLILHGLLWGFFLKAAVDYLHSSEDPWYQMARGDYFKTFIGVQFSLLPYYAAISLLFAYFASSALQWWHHIKPFKGPFPVKRLLALWIWFWLSWILLSWLSYYTSWLVPFSIVEQKLGLTITHKTLQLMSPFIYLNFLALLLVLLLPLKKHITTKRASLCGLMVVGALAGFLAKDRIFHAPPVSSTNSSQPHIIIIGSDALRADRLGIYGYKRPTSPHIDAIAQEGVICDRMYVTSPSTTESLLSFITGMTPQESGIRSIFYGPQEIEKVKAQPGLISTLRQKGYRTVALGDWSASDLGRLADFDFIDVEPEMDFVGYIDEAARRIHLPLLAFFATPLNSWIAPNFVGLLISKHTAESSLTLAEKEIEQASHSNQPLFLFTFLSTTHLPFAIPEGEPITFGDPHYKGKHERQLNFSSLDAISTADLSTELKDESQRIKDLYDSTVWLFDRQVARLEKAVQKYHLNNTLFIILSDHGEDQWDPGVGLSRTLHAEDQSIRIPFIVRWKNHFPPRRIPHLLRATDVVPTLIDIIHASGHDSQKSFKTLLKGEDLPDDRMAFIEAGISWTGPTLYPPDGAHLSYPGITSLAAPDRSIDSMLLIPPDKMNLVMKAKDRVLIQGPYKVAYQPMKSAPLVDMCNLSKDPWCEHRLPPDPVLAQKLKAQIMKDPEAYYLAWPREVFDKVFPSQMTSR